MRSLLCGALAIMVSAVSLMAETPGILMKQTASGSDASSTVAAAPLPAGFGARRPGLHTYRLPSAVSMDGKDGVMGSPLRAEGKTVEFYGSLIYSGEWGPENRPYGIYSMPLSDPAAISPVHLDRVLNANAGGVYYEGKFCFVNYFDSMGAILAYYYVYDANTWEKILSGRVPNTSIATDLTWDPVSRQIYGCFINSTNDGYTFGSMDPQTGSVTAISELGANPFFFVAASPGGKIYGVMGDGVLYEIDKFVGNWTKIGNTGIIPYNSQSATFDFKHDKLYWAACTRNNAGLYEVDVKTGHASCIKLFAHGEEFGGLYIPDPEAADLAPDEVKDFTISYIPGTTADLKVEFTMPRQTYDGTTSLTGNMQYIISVNDEEKDIRSARAGEKVSFVQPYNSIGQVSIGITPMNDAGRGPMRKVTVWTGKDYPKVVKDLTWHYVNAKTVEISWNPPTEGTHEGYIDQNKLSYKVVRRPDNKVIAENLTRTSVIDATDVSKLSYFYYDVTAVCNGFVGETASTGKVIVGDALEMPYLEQFNTESDFDMFTVKDANNDGRTWKYDYLPQAFCEYSLMNDMDDWLITPPLHLKNDRLYTLTFDVKASSGFTDSFDVALGDAPTVEAMTTELIGRSTVSGSNFETFTATIRVDEDKTYYIGFHDTSAAGAWYLYLDNISVVEDCLLAAPATVTDFNAVTGDKGALTVDLSFKAPTKTIGGEPLALSDITSIKLLRDGKIQKMFTGAEISATMTYADRTPTQGINTYKIIATTAAAGDGAAKTAEVFVGIDKPGLPRNVRLTEVEGRAHLTWDAPESGEHGGWFDPDNLSYLVGSPAEDGNVSVIVTDYKDTSIDLTVELPAQQSEVVLAVFAKSTGGINNYGQVSNSLIMGDPFDLPMYESFADGVPSQSWWVKVPSSSNGYWEANKYGLLPTCDAQDLDNGMVSFWPDKVGDDGFIHSGKLSTANLTDPTLEFYYYNKRGSNDYIEVRVTNNGVDWHTAEKITFTDLSIPNGWAHKTVNLKQYATTGIIMVGFYVYSADGISNFHFDNISVRQIYTHDLEAAKLLAPSKLGIGSQAGLNVKVINRGTAISGKYDVALYRNGNVVETQHGDALESGSSKSFVFNQTADNTFGDEVAYYAKVNYASDLDMSNNTTETVNVEIIQPSYPSITDLAAELDGNQATLTWSTPDYKTVTEDFETLTPFIISGIGEWTTIDRDGSGTAVIGGMALEDLWPNAYEPQAWIVFNPELLNVHVNDDGTPSIFATHSGSQMLISFAADQGRNDDWLISPRLNGKAQTISFWVKSATTLYGSEEYEILTSTNPTIDISAFGHRDYNYEVSEEWTKITFDVEEGTSYFAIRNIGSDRYALCIDDITFAPASAASITLDGFNVYCNDEKINGELISGNSYLVDIDELRPYVYTVTAVYGGVESKKSNSVRIDLSGFDSPLSGAVSVTGGRGEIVISGADGVEFAVYASDGITVVKDVTGNNVHRVAVVPGIYLVKVSGKVYKVLVN